MALLSVVQSRVGLTILVFASAIGALIAAAYNVEDVSKPHLSRSYETGVILLASETISILGLLLILTGLIPGKKRLWDRLTFDGSILLSWLSISSTMALSFLYVDLLYGPYSFPDDIPSCASMRKTMIWTMVSFHCMAMSSAALGLVLLAGECTERNRAASLLWDMALAPIPEPADDTFSQPVYGAASEVERAQQTSRDGEPDKFQAGRLVCYAPLLVLSTWASVGASVLTAFAPEHNAALPVNITGIVSTLFSMYYLATHRKEQTQLQRKLEVAFGTAIFLAWPCCAIALSIYPGSARGCTAGGTPPPPGQNPPTPNPGWIDLENPVYHVVFTLICAWVATWVMFYRLVGLVFPMPDVIVFRRRDLPPGHGPEGESLLGRHVGEAGPSAGVDPAEADEPSAKDKGKLSSSGGSDEEQGILLAGAEFELNEEEEQTRVTSK